MDASMTAQTILEYVGGKENVLKNMICISRLRLDLKDETKVDLDAIKAMDGVLGIIEAGNLQIVLGQTNVKRVGEAFSELTGLPLDLVQMVCVPGKPCAYDLETEDTQGILKKILSVFGKKK